MYAVQTSLGIWQSNIIYLCKLIQPVIYALCALAYCNVSEQTQPTLFNLTFPLQQQGIAKGRRER